MILITLARIAIVTAVITAIFLSFPASATDLTFQFKNPSFNGAGQSAHFLTIKYILESVIGQVNGIHGIVQALDVRVKTMNHDIIRLDATMCSVLGIRPDLNRIARADGKEDARRD